MKADEPSGSQNNQYFRPCQILKVKSPFLFEIKDLSESENKNSIHLRLDSDRGANSDSDIQQKLYHILPQLVRNDKSTSVTFRLQSENKGSKQLNEKTQSSESHQKKVIPFQPPSQQYSYREAHEEYPGELFINGKSILDLLTSSKATAVDNDNSGDRTIEASNEIKEYQPEQIIQCYVIKVQCLKLVLLNLQDIKYVTFYFSEFKLPRPTDVHPKEAWDAAQKYFDHFLLGDFVQIKVNGTERYREQMNIYGEVLRMRNGDDVKEKFLSDGYVQLSKNCSKYLSEESVKHFESLTEDAKSHFRGIWGLKIKNNPAAKKSSNQNDEIKFKKWEGWIDSKALKLIKKPEQELSQLNSELKRHTGSKLDFHKVKVVLSAIQMILNAYEESVKLFRTMDDTMKVLSQILVQSQISVFNNINSMEFLKFYSKSITMGIFYLDRLSEIIDPKKNEKYPIASEMEKILKIAFKTSFMGNETFHERLFGKKKQSNFDSFSFDSAYLNGGISSYSEQSDYEEYEKVKFKSKESKKIASAHLKVRINSTYLISLILKHYPSIVQNHWQVCVRSNILSSDFFEFLKKQKIRAESTNISEDEKKELLNLMKSNFGDPSLLLLTIFERNPKVRLNAINCILNMINNFQGKKMINTTESFYIEKLLKSTKSSFVPKSYIIFSGLKNILYFLLFTLKYEKNIEIIQLSFKTLCELCNQCSLLDKLEFEDGMELLMENYIQPVLAFPWDIVELEELKIVCISFLSVLVSTQKKWDQIEERYLLSSGQDNINGRLIRILRSMSQKVDSKKGEQSGFSKIFLEIVKYFTKLTKKYFESIFFEFSNESKESVWKFLSKLSLSRMDSVFSNFISEVFKSNFDKAKMEEELSKEKDYSRRSSEYPLQQYRQINRGLIQFLDEFILVYSSSVTNEIYLSLIEILTNISYDSWSVDESSQGSNDSLVHTKNFLMGIFGNLTTVSHYEGLPKSQKVFPSIEPIKSNALVRIGLIKLIGYMSFCPQFQKPELLQASIKLLIDYSKSYKSLNSIVKITWAISNWVKVEGYGTILSPQQLSESINYLVSHAGSDKEKVASNTTRGIGFFLGSLSQLTDDQTKSEKKELEGLSRKCRKSILQNLQHPIIKVRTNGVKTLRKILPQLSQEEIGQIVPVLEQNLLKNNYHLQTETLLLIKQLDSPIDPKRLVGLYLTILKNLNNQSTLEYDFSEIKTVKLLRMTVLEEILDNIQYIVHKEDTKDIFMSIYAFLVDCSEQDQNKKQNHKMLEKGEEKGEEVEKLIFNLKREQKYDEQNVVSTQTALKGLQFKASPGNLKLIQKIKKVSQNDKEKTLSIEWQQLENLSIEEDMVTMNNIFV